MNKINYQKQLDKVIENLGETKPTLLLHSCCAPCSSYVMEYLSQYFDITIDYYNPNIDSKEEYEKRVHEQQRLVSEMNLPIKVIDAGYAPQTFFDMAKGYEQEPEGGKRCYRCYKLRLDQAAKLAQEGGYDYFTTTLTISPLKNATWLNELGQKAGELAGVRFLHLILKRKVVIRNLFNYRKNIICIVRISADVFFLKERVKSGCIKKKTYKNTKKYLQRQKIYDRIFTICREIFLK